MVLSRKIFFKFSRMIAILEKEVADSATYIKGRRNVRISPEGCRQYT